MQLQENWKDALERWCDTTSQSQVAKLLGFSTATIGQVRREVYPANPNNIRVRIESLLVGKEVPQDLIDFKQGYKQVYPRKLFQPWVHDSAPITEKRVQYLLAKRERGQIEVPCAAGYIDFLTVKEVVEIKNWVAWKEAIKVLIYVEYFPGRTPRVHLFNNENLDTETRQMIEGHYQKLGIRLTWESPFLYDC